MDAQKKVLIVPLWRSNADAEPLVLCLRRPPKDGSVWQTPTGGVEVGEDFEAAALREILEETGLTAPAALCLGMEQNFVGRWGPCFERAYRVEWTGGAQPPSVQMDPNEHEAYEWLSPREAMDRVHFPFNREAIHRAVFPLVPLKLTQNGEWFQDGEEITHTRTVEFLWRSLMRKAQGYVIKHGREELPVMVEDTALFVRAISGDGSLELLNGERAALEPATLEVGLNHVLYCQIKGERARFLRAAYYELSRSIEERLVAGKTEYVLHWQGRDYLLRVSH